MKKLCIHVNEVHQKSEKAKCNFCLKEFHVRSLKKHIKTAHLNSKQDHTIQIENVHETECKLCNIKFKGIKELQNHIIASHVTFISKNSVTD